MNNEIFKSPESFREALKAVQTQSPAPAEVPTGLSVESANMQQPSTESSSSLSVGGGSEHGVQVNTSQETHEKNVDSSSETESHNITNNDTNSHLIPKSRFNQEVERRKELESKYTQEREKAIRAEARAEELAKLQAQKTVEPPRAQPQEPQIIPLDTEAHSYYQKKIAELESKVNTVAQHTSLETQRMYQLNMLNAQEAAFAKNHPDYVDALKYIKEVETNIAREFIEESKVDAYVAQKLQSMAQIALNSGQNTAEKVYNVAKKYGYSSAQNAAKDISQASKEPNLDAINKNAPKSANTNNVGGSAVNVGGIGAINIEAALANPDSKYSYVDPVKFRELLKKTQQRQVR